MTYKGTLIVSKPINKKETITFYIFKQHLLKIETVKL
jgi:hypothetical protein